MKHLAKGGDLVAGDLTVGLGHLCPQRDHRDGKADPFFGRLAGPVKDLGQAFAVAQRAKRHRPGVTRMSSASPGRRKRLAHQHQIVAAVEFPANLGQPGNRFEADRGMKAMPSRLPATIPAHRLSTPAARACASSPAISARPTPRPRAPGARMIVCSIVRA